MQNRIKGIKFTKDEESVLYSSHRTSVPSPLAPPTRALEWEIAICGTDVGPTNESEERPKLFSEDQAACLDSL